MLSVYSLARPPELFTLSYYKSNCGVVFTSLPTICQPPRITGYIDLRQGKNIQGTKEVQKIARSKDAMRYLSNNRVSWKFIVQKAPWWGGFLERLIQSAQRCLKTSIVRTTLSYDELQTLLIEVETVVNWKMITMANICL